MNLTPQFRMLLVLGVVVDALLQWGFWSLGNDWGQAQLSAFCIVALALCLPTRFFGFSRPMPWWWALVVGLSALVARAGVGEIYAQYWPNEELVRVLASSATLVAVFYAGVRSAPTVGGVTAESSGELILKCAPFLIASTIGLRLLYMPLLNLMSQEAYYWKYAENLDIGYLDHPPAVAVLIALGQAAFGMNEFGARSGAMCCWLLMVYFLSRLAFEWFDRRVALVTVLLLSLLPFHSAMGFFITPDAPLVAAWAGALFFLHRVFLRQRASAWYAVGLCIGIGMLSKYPMVLIGPPIVLFMLFDAQSRHWLLKPQPYAAALLAALVFSPVLFWNSANEWASFAFQGPRRFEALPEISTHLLLAFFLLLLTPVGAWFLTLLFSPPSIQERSSMKQLLPINRRLKLFVGLFTFAPISVFLYASFSQEIKVNWIGPALLAAIPLLALPLVPGARLLPTGQRAFVRLQKAWLVSLVACFLAISAALYYLAIGIPGVPYGKAMKKFLGWQELGATVLAREELIHKKTGVWPVVMGADSHYVGSQIGFYRAKLSRQRAKPLPEPSQGRSLFGANSLMYHFWTKPELNIGRTILMVSRTRGDLEDAIAAPFFGSLSEIEEVTLKIRGSNVGSYFLRVGKEYRLPSRDIR